MTVTQAVLSLSRLRPRALARRLVGSALSNARRSLDDLTVAVDDRRHQREDLEGAASPGDLRRLSSGACLELLSSKTYGRLAYVARSGLPDIVPVNYLLHDGAVLIRAGAGPKLQAAERGEQVAFEVDDVDEQSHTGWSVVVVGRAERLSAQEAADLPLPEPWPQGGRHQTLRLQPRRVEGRQLL